MDYFTLTSHFHFVSTVDMPVRVYLMLSIRLLRAMRTVQWCVSDNC